MRFKIFSIALSCLITVPALADEFDVNRWYGILNRIQAAAIEQKISSNTINGVIQESIFIPDVIARDKNQAEFTLTMGEYLKKTIDPLRIRNGKIIEKKYPTILKRTEDKYGIPQNVIMALWGMESDYGRFKSQYKLSDSFLTLIYDGRREAFFEQQLFALMKLADKGHLNVGTIKGSWAGAIGHFQFMPMTLAQYGVDGNNDGKIDVYNSIGDAMASAGNYLSRMGWKRGEKIAREVKIPENFDMTLCDSKTKLPLFQWANFGVIGVPQANKTAGLVCDISIFPTAYLTYDNFYKLKRWNNSNYYATAVAILSDKLK